MSFSGMTCEANRHNHIILKNFSPKTRFSKIWFQIKDLPSQICKYNHDLIESKLKVPNLLGLAFKNEIIEIQQEWIEGDKLSDLLPKLEKEHLFELFTQLLKLQKQVYYHNPILRIDLNIENFIINKAGELYLVDITPPLYLNSISYPDSFADQCYFHLCFSRINQVCELLFSFLKKTVLLSFDSQAIDSTFEVLIKLADEVWKDNLGSLRHQFNQIDELNYDSFGRTLARLKVVQSFCNNEIDTQMFNKLLKEMSISYILKHYSELV